MVLITFRLLLPAKQLKILNSLLFNDAEIKRRKSIIVPASLTGCEIWFLALREEHRLTIYNRSLRSAFGLMGDEFTRGAKNCITRNVYSSLDTLRVIISR